MKREGMDPLGMRSEWSDEGEMRRKEVETIQRYWATSEIGSDIFE